MPCKVKKSHEISKIDDRENKSIKEINEWTKKQHNGGHIQVKEIEVHQDLGGAMPFKNWQEYNG